MDGTRFCSPATTKSLKGSLGERKREDLEEDSSWKKGISVKPEGHLGEVVGPALVMCPFPRISHGDIRIHVLIDVHFRSDGESSFTHKISCAGMLTIA